MNDTTRTNPVASTDPITRAALPGTQDLYADVAAEFDCGHTAARHLAASAAIDAAPPTPGSPLAQPGMNVELDIGSQALHTMQNATTELLSRAARQAQQFNQHFQERMAAYYQQRAQSPTRASTSGTGATACNSEVIDVVARESARNGS